MGNYLLGVNVGCSRGFIVLPQQPEAESVIIYLAENQYRKFVLQPVNTSHVVNSSHEV